MEGTWNPGSDGARRRGCKCPAIDNGHGQGLYIDEHGDRQFVVNLECPMHGAKWEERDSGKAEP